MDNIVLALVGMCGAGKSVAAQFFENKGFRSLRFGEITMDLVKERGLEVSEKNEKKIRESLRDEYGMGAFAQLNLPKIEKFLKKGNVVADGLYSWAEYKILKEHFKERLLVAAIFTSRKLRYDRLSKRDIRPLSFEDARSRDYAEIENIEKGGPIAIADYTVINDGNMARLEKSLAKLLDTIIKAA